MGIRREIILTHGEVSRNGRWESAERAFQHEERQVEMGGDGNQQRESIPTRGEVCRSVRRWKSAKRAY